MSKKYNFSAGPAMLPAAVMAQVQKDLCNFQGMGVGLMEISHRSSTFLDFAQEFTTVLRELLQIPENYHTLFLQGGARGQFSAIPQNLLPADGLAQYLISGFWSASAAEEAQQFVQVKRHDVKEQNAQGQWFINTPESLTTDAAYVHLCSNETIEGLRFHALPKTDKPLIADMSSCLLSEPINVSDYGLIYACAQKNIGPAGLTLVIVRDDLLDMHPQKNVPSILDYEVQAKTQSLYNTPATFSWYVAGEVFKWIKAQGGLAVMAEMNQKKSAYLYDYLDQSDFYVNTIAPCSRSRMNIPFQLKDTALDAPFLKEAEQAGLLFLKGHRVVGGMRASLYNAMPFDGVKALVDFMDRFASQQPR